MLYTGDRFNNIGDIIAVIFILGQLLYIPIATLLFLLKAQSLPRRGKLSKKMYSTFILLFAVISTTLWIVFQSITRF